jgi:putative PIN family toxin of toxin-antitoxin system
MIRTEKFVVDTNTLVSSFLKSDSVTCKTVKKAQSKGVLIFSNETFAEFKEVLLREKFDRYFLEDSRLEILNNIYNIGVFITVASNFRYCRDPKDDKFLTLAFEAHASCIITGDNDLLVLGDILDINVISPFNFLNYF